MLLTMGLRGRGKWVFWVEVVGGATWLFLGYLIGVEVCWFGELEDQDGLGKERTVRSNILVDHDRCWVLGNERYF
jgi:hypothetical protein